MTDDEKIFAFRALAEERLEIFEGSVWGESGGMEYLRFVAGLGAYEGGGLQAALERAGDDKVELDVQGVQHMGKLEAVFFAFLVEGTFLVQGWVSAAKSGAGVAEDKNIHNLLIV
jgi:hypothetical protein